MRHDQPMWFGSFLFRTLWLSLVVALFWLPVLVIFGYGVFFLFEIFRNEPIALGMIIILTLQPVMVLLAIFAIRGGMMALNVTRGTELHSLGKIVFRISRFNLPLMWIITSLFGLGTTITGLRLMNSEFITDFQRAKDIDSMRDIARFFDVLGEFPVLLLGGWLFGACVAFALLGVSVAGASAMAAVKPPNHHTIWGIASQFVNLFLLSMVLMMLPFDWAVMTLGVDSTMADVMALEGIVYYGGVGYFTWATCGLAAGAALAYSLTVAREKVEYQEMMDAIGGSITEGPDLKSLRESRMKK